MSWTPPTVYVVTMPAAATLTSAFDLQRNWKTVYLDMVTLSTGANLFVQAAAIEGGTFRRVYHPVINSSSAQANVFTITTAASGGYIPIPNGLRFMKIEVGTAPAVQAEFKLICSD